ncbi:OLC1v1015540C1 [Oldenlandia corymbosa var. corymbosa]|uniref:OLC1v1015540C1 n=1 Tax=Oldenlandia corymbosa var. corymbosa TaxID=529605 RepID=A0AAV1E6P4_OLDCO|nr:OLC1v1015540C1 [Oldenlandia corymbosa var. corymbosa]
MAATISLCSSLTPTAASSSSLSSSSSPNFVSKTSNSSCVNFLSHSLSSLKLTPCPKKSTPFSFVPKFAQTEIAPSLTDDEAAEPITAIGNLGSPVSGEPKKEEVFAVVMVGSRQYIVFPGRYIYTQRLKGANVNDKIILNKVLLVGTKTSTYIGQPVVANAAVHAVVEEQLLDKKVIVFKYKKKKNYRRNIGHRQPITRIRIMGITGYENSPAVTLP